MSERSGVQNPIIKYAQELGWEYVHRAEAEKMRAFFEAQTPLFFGDVLHQKVTEFNPKYAENKEFLLRQVSTLPNSATGNRDFLNFLKGQTTFFDESERRELNLKPIDFENPANNVYQVTDEYYYRNNKFGNREDVVFLINGIPIVVVEAKGANKQEAIALGVDQIRRYHLETPEMMVPEQIFAVTESLGFSYGVTWSLSRRNIFNWKDEETGNLEKKAKTFFEKERILDYIKNYIFFAEKNEELEKYILRQHQVAAVEKVVERAHDTTKFRGLVWHTQGSGKTFTMIKIAEMLFKASEEKPTILMLIDRNELEGQLVGNLRSVGIENVELANSIDGLNKLLKNDYRGIIVSMIHKLHGMSANINTKSSIYCLIDEAHRTTQGDLGNYLFAAIPNATFIGFTGTPIDKTAYGRGTFKTFGIDDKQGYLHKYSIAESVADGTTVPLYYSLAPNELLLDRDLLEKEFLILAEAEGISDIEELNKILEKAVNIKNFLKGKNRVDKIAKFVAEHYKENVEPLGYKAFLVGVDREACALYKKALDKYLPKEYSEVVYTGNNNDSQLLKEFHISEDKEKEVRKAFTKYGTTPKILIVTEKLLTGYDAPILYSMYLDKPMRDHTLLQAIARVNRPYENEQVGMIKPHGFVLDFIGIFDKLEKALAFDSDEVNAVIKDLGLLKNLFEKRMKSDVPKYLTLIKGEFTDKTTDGLIDYFRDKSERQTFFKLYKEIEALYEIISPDAFLRPYIGSYAILSKIYLVVRNAFAPKIIIDREFLRKTNKLVQKEVDVTDIVGGKDIFAIDKDTLKKIKESNENDNVKIINLIKSIQKYAEEHANDPFLISLAQRAQAIQELYEERQITTQETLKQLMDLAEKEITSQDDRAKEGLNEKEYFVFKTLSDYGVKDAKEFAQRIAASFEQYPNFADRESQMRDLRLELYAALKESNLSEDQELKIIDFLFNVLSQIYEKRS